MPTNALGFSFGIQAREVVTPGALLRRLGVSPTPQLFTRSEQIWQSLSTAPAPLGPLPAELRNISDLQEHWIERLAFGPTPLHDRLAQTLAGLFAVHLSKVPDLGQFWQHLETIRQQLRGGYGQLLVAMLADPATLRNLDGLASHRKSPNENLARELMELYSVGAGSFQESDVISGARALSGYRLRQGQIVMDEGAHDPGPMRVLGKLASFDAASLATWLVSQPAAARMILTRLWRVWQGDLPTAANLNQLADQWRQKQLSLPWLVQRLLELPSQRRSLAQGAMVREPIDLMVAALRLLGSRQKEGLRLARLQLRAMGQVPFEPPSIKGWPADRQWITDSWLRARQRAMRSLVNHPELWESNQLPPMLEAHLVPRQPFSLRLPAPATKANLLALLTDPVWQLK